MRDFRSLTLVQVRTNATIDFITLDLTPQYRDLYNGAEPESIEATEERVVLAAPPTGKAPEFVVQINTEPVRDGRTADFKCEIVGEPRPLIDWQYNKRHLKDDGKYTMYEDQSLHQLEIYDIPAEKALAQVARASKEDDITGDEKMNLDLEAEKVEPPKFTLDIKTTAVNQGEKARLFGNVIGAPRPTVLWKKDGKQIRKGDNRYIIEYGESGDVSLVILEVISGDAGQYIVEAANKAGQAVSEAPLDVHTPPVITKSPEELTITELERTSLLCNITGNPRPTVTWTKGDDVPLTDEKLYHIEDYDDSYLFEINKTYPTDQGVYTVTAVNPVGQATAHIKLNVQPVKHEAPESPQILRHKESTKPPQFVEVFKDTTIDEDDKLTLKCKVIGVPRPDVTWYRGEEKIVPSKLVKLTHEEDLCTLHVSKAPLGYSGKYTCVAVNSAGEAKISANVTVSEYCEPPEFTRELRDDQVKLGRPVKLACKVTGIPTPECEWYFGDTKLTPSAHHKMDSKYDKKEQETNLTLTIDAIKEGESGVYKCVAKNVVGEANTECRITIEEKKEAPKFLRKPDNVECYEGQKAMFDCEIQATPIPTVTWSFGDKPLKATDRVTMEQKDQTYTLRLETTVNKDSGLYSVRAQNEAGSQFAQARLKVLQAKPPKFEKKPENVTSPKHGKATFSCKVSGIPTPELEWSLREQKLEPSDTVKFEYDKKSNIHTVTIDQTTETDAGVLKIVATNCAGQATAESNLSVKGLAPKFIEEPIKCVVLEKQTCVFKTKIIGEPTPKVEWSKGKWTTYKNGGNIKIYYDENIDMHVIEIAAVKEKDAGTYQCKISNQYGTETCSVTLMVTKDEEAVADWKKSLAHREEPAKPAEVSEEVDFGVKLKKRQEAEPEVQAETKQPELTHIDFDQKTEKPAFQRHEVEELDFDFKKLDLSTRERPDIETVDIDREKKEKDVVVEEEVQAAYQRPDKAPPKDEVDASLELKIGKGKWEFTKPLEDQTVKEKTNAIFQVETSVRNAPTDWYINGQKVTPSTKHQIEVDGKIQRLIINNCAKDDECSVSCTLKDAKTEAALNVVVAEPIFLTPIQEQKCTEHETVKFSCSTDRPTTLQWLKNGQPVSGERFDVQSIGCDHSLTIRDAHLDDQANYMAKAGKSETSAMLYVSGMPRSK